MLGRSRFWPSFLGMSFHPKVYKTLSCDCLNGGSFQCIFWLQASELRIILPGTSGHHQPEIGGPGLLVEAEMTVTNAPFLGKVQKFQDHVI